MEFLNGMDFSRTCGGPVRDGTVEEAVSRTVKGGCFAVGLLILLTQFTLTAKFAAMGMEPPQLGDSYETDLILNGAASELIADAFFEAVALIGKVPSVHNNTFSPLNLRLSTELRETLAFYWRWTA